MIVKELIEQLQQLSPTAPVKISYVSGDLSWRAKMSYEIDQVEIVDGRNFDAKDEKVVLLG